MERAQRGRQFRYYAAQTPGVTGVWQLYFRSGSDYNARLVTTRYYFRRWSPAIDLRLLIETVKVPFLRDSAY